MGVQRMNAARQREQRISALELLLTVGQLGQGTEGQRVAWALSQQRLGVASSGEVVLLLDAQHAQARQQVELPQAFAALLEPLLQRPSSLGEIGAAVHLLQSLARRLRTGSTEEQCLFQVVARPQLIVGQNGHLRRRQQGRSALGLAEVGCSPPGSIGSSQVVLSAGQHLGQSSPRDLRTQLACTAKSLGGSGQIAP